MRRARTGLISAIAALATVASVSACGSSGGGGGGTSSSGTSAKGGGSSTGALKIGYILPQTGQLAKEGLGAPQIAAVKYAVKVINDAGGVNGTKVPSPPPGQDETDSPSKAASNVQNLLNAGENVIIGAAASGQTLAIINKVVQAGVVECSGSNTTPTLTNYKDNGYYFRTAPSDALQGPVLGNLVVRTGHKKVAIAYRSDDYGKGLSKATAAAIKKAGGQVVLNESYGTKATTFGALVSKIQSARPDAIVLVSFGEAAEIIKSLIEAGIGPKKVALFGTDGTRSEKLPAQVNPGNPKVLDGMMGTADASTKNKTFISNLKKFDPKLQTEQYAPQVFDCTVIAALAADEAHSNNPAKIKQHMIDVTKG
ncbi:MAG: ABC transporter substrate-binding protein, partial [Trebonia sp.]